MLQAGDHPQDALLRAVGQLGLEPDQVVGGAVAVLHAQLDDRIGPRVGFRIQQAHRLHRPEHHGVAAALGHDLDGNAALEVGHLLEVLGDDLLGLQQGLVKGVVLRLGHGAVEVVGALVVARRPEDDGHVDAVGVHDRRDRVVEVEVLGVRQALEVLGQRVGGQRARGHDRRAVGRNLRHRLVQDANVRVALQGLRDRLREEVAVHGQGRARRHPHRVRRFDDEGAQAAHLFLEDAGGALDFGGAEGVGADQFGQVPGLVGGCLLLGAHLVEGDPGATIRSLPGGLGAGQAPADDDDILAHGGQSQ